MGIFDNIKKKTSEFTSQFGEKNANTKSSSSDFLSPELSMLIDSAIIDGEITDTSRETLHKRAMREGIEPDELDLIINSRIAKSKPTQTPPTQQQQPPAPPAMPKMHSNKHGEIKKCPNCGAPIAAFSVHCEMCGHEFTNVEASTNISILFEKLQELDNQQSQQLIQRGKTGRVFGSITRSLTSIDLDSPIKEDFLNKKINIIKTFPIGNSKSEILEFLSMAAPLGARKSIFYNEEENQAELRKAWRDKCVQVIIRARMLLKNDPDAMCQIEKYAKDFKVK